jgi:hypothetical protein
MEKEKYNERMCRYIWHDILQHSIKTLSWGVDFARVKVIKNGTEFHVQGFKITGIVRVQYVEGSDLFKVTIIPDNNQEKPIIIEDVYLDMLVSVIDEAVEHCENYEKRVCDEYGLDRNLVAV